MFVVLKTEHTMITQLPPIGEIKRFFPNFRIDRVKVFVLLLQCILQGRTTCINKLKTYVGLVINKTDYNLGTAYTRLLRFFKLTKVDEFCIGIIWLILHLFNFEQEMYMSLDRTNWKIGKKNINVLFIGLILPNGAFIPVVWQLYNKRGNSSEQERCDLLNRFFKVWNRYPDLKLTMLGDREFIGADWFDYLLKTGFSFVIRARKQDYWQEIPTLKNKTITQIEKKIRREIKRKGYFQKSFVLKGNLLYYTVFENTSKRHKKNDDLLILISDNYEVDWISSSFPKRWKIEVFFKHCKSNGFNLQDLNLSKMEKAYLMMGVISVCYVLSILNGVKKRTTEKIDYKNYNGKVYPSVSLFRTGYDNLKNQVHRFTDLIDFVSIIMKPIPASQYWQMKIALESV